MEKDWARERILHGARLVVLVLSVLQALILFSGIPTITKHRDAWTAARAYVGAHRTQLEKNARDFDKAVIKSDPNGAKLLQVMKEVREQLLRFALARDGLVKLAIISLLYVAIAFFLLGRVRVDVFHYLTWGADLILVCSLLGITWIFKSETGLISPFALLPVLLVFSNTFSQERHVGLVSAAVTGLACAVVFVLRALSPPLGVPVPWGYLLFMEGLIFLTGALGYFQGLFVEGRLEQTMDKDKLLERAYKISREQAQEREKKELQLNETLRRVTSLVQISHSIASTHDLGELLSLIITKAREEMNSSMAFLMQIHNGDLAVEHSFGISDLTKGILQCKVGEGIFGGVVKTGTPVRLSEKDGDPRFGSLNLAKEKFRTILCVPLQTPQDRKPFGVLCVANILVGDGFTALHEDYLNILSTAAAISIKNVNLYADLERSYYEIILALAQAIEAKDIYTRGHVGRVMKHSLRIARALKLPEEELKIIEKAAILHDIGKIAIPDSILQKNGPLTPEERTLMNQHAEASRNILKDISSLSDKVLDLVMHHHERFDGKGYPHGLREDEIPLGAQIIAVADTFDAMTSDRPYRKGFSYDEALRLLRDCSGTQFDPRILNAFFSLFDAAESLRPTQIDIDRNRP
jgi:HD-GYP domain-containing protein (c-di-GMP phosphodiesterase class II)